MGVFIKIYGLRSVYVQKVSLLLGYTLSVSSQLNIGTTVTVNLPADEFSVAD